MDGTQVICTSVDKHLGSQVAWASPTKTAIDARKVLAHSSHMKLQSLWVSKLNIGDNTGTIIIGVIQQDIRSSDYGIIPLPSSARVVPVRWGPFGRPTWKNSNSIPQAKEPKTSCGWHII